MQNKPEGALLRTYLRAAGVAPESLAKPLVGVVTVSTQISSERADAKELGSAVVAGLEAAGGIAVRWDTVRTPDQVSLGRAESYNFAWRDQLADFIESWAKQETLDGLVLVGDSTKTLVGMAMAAARLNLPAAIVTTGATRSIHKPEEAGNGHKDKQEQLFKACLMAQDNHASHAMDLVLEALGLCLPGMSTASVQSPRRHELAYGSAERVVTLIKSGFTARRVLTTNAFSNAIRFNAALGGSVDVAVHLMALAHEAGVSLSIDQFDRIAKETPQICRLGGVGVKDPHRIEDLDRAGGVWSVMNGLKNRILPTPTIGGKGALELAKTATVKDAHVILGSRPYAKQSGVGVLRGNLAPSGAAFLLNQVHPSLAIFRGPAIVFDTEIDAAKMISEAKVKKGSVIFVRGQGPKGGPGLRKLRVLPALLESRGLNKIFPVITDGRLPDTPAGLFISFLSPESAVSGPLAILKSGDIVEINIPSRQMMVRLTEMEMKIRQTRWQAPVTTMKRGFLERYSRSVSEAHEGAVLK